jgi:hypothetical protein
MTSLPVMRRTDELSTTTAGMIGLLTRSCQDVRLRRSRVRL